MKRVCLCVCVYLQHQQHLSDSWRDRGCSSQCFFQLELQQYQVSEGQKGHLPHCQLLTLNTHRHTRLDNPLISLIK